MPLDEIVYTGSDQYSEHERAAPGSIPIELYGEPLVRAGDTAYIIFQVRDLQRTRKPSCRISVWSKRVK